MEQTEAELIDEIEDIIDEIEGHIENRGGAFSSWYVGIAADARDRLFNDHSVEEEADKWIIRKATSSSVARTVEKYFIEEKGTKGGPGGGDENSKFVYAYKIQRHTRE